MSRAAMVDDRLALDTVEVLLHGVGFRVRRAANGPEGLACFRIEPPELAQANIIISEHEGIETILEMRCLRPDARIVAASGGGAIGRDRLLDMTAKLGADRTLAKPFESEELSTAIRQAIADAR
jgi:two-component system, chemotaxis family, chemotaxis protein CheY